MQNTTVLGCCDKELLGKTLSDDKYNLTINVNFYKGKKVDKEELGKMMDEANSINLFGEKCIKIAIEKGLISEEDIIKINGIPHIQIYKI